MNIRLLMSAAATLLTASALLVPASPALAQMGFGRPHPNGFDPSAGVPRSTPTPRPGFPAPGLAPPPYTPPKPKTYVTPAPRPPAPIGAIDSGDTFKPYKPAKGVSTYEGGTAGAKRKPGFSTY